MHSITDHSIARVVGYISLLSHLHTMLIVEDVATINCALDDLADDESEFSHIIIGYLGEVELNVPNLIAAIARAIAHPKEEILLLYNDVVEPITDLILASNVSAEGTWTCKSGNDWVSFDPANGLITSNLGINIYQAIYTVAASVIKDAAKIDAESTPTKIPLLNKILYKLDKRSNCV